MPDAGAVARLTCDVDISRNRIMVESYQEGNDIPRAGVYIDGFNLYHSIHSWNEPYLKWCDLWALSEILCAPNGHRVEKVVLCTAYPKHQDDGTCRRHQSFCNAQRAVGVTVIEGHYIYDSDAKKYTEKQSDINVALSLICDMTDKAVDCAYLLSADSDQSATARVFRERFPAKWLATVAPPDRRPPEKSAPFANVKFSIKRTQIEDVLLPGYVPNPDGGFVRRPQEYDPPQGWLPPSQRPKRKR